MIVCYWCKEPLKAIPGKGYVHEGGGLYVQKCKRCSWKGSFENLMFFCPKCGGKLVDDHCALPIRRKGVKLGVVGSRRRNSLEDKELLKKRIKALNPEIIITGGCPKGADRFAEEIAKELNIPIKIYYPEQVFPEAPYFVRVKAYYDRNQKIAEESDYLIALVAEDRKGGTEDTIIRFRKLGKTNLEIL